MKAKLVATTQGDNLLDKFADVMADAARKPRDTFLDIYLSTIHKFLRDAPAVDVHIMMQQAK